MKRNVLSNTLFQYRLLMAAAGIAFPAFGYFLISSVPNVNDSMQVRLIHGAICFLVFALTFFLPWAKKNIEKIVYFFAFVFSFWDAWITSRNIHSQEYIFSIMITFMAAGLILPDIKMLLLYAGMMFVSVPFFGILFGEPKWALSFYLTSFYTMASFSMIIMMIHLRIKDRLGEANRDLKKVNHELDSFIYRASHDLTAPLNSIRGIVSLMDMTEGLTPAHREYLSMIEKSINKLHHYIGDLLNFSRNSKMEMQIQPIDFNTLVASVLHQLGYSKETNKINITTEIKSSVPFHSDPKRMEIIFNNIISNTIKYRDDLKENPELKIVVTINSKNALIRFSDNGIGIEPEHLSKIFNMFYRASTISSGTGVGLYIVKEVAEKLGGKITATSTPGEGTIFNVTLANHFTKPAKLSLL